MIEYNKTNPLRVVTLFSGYDSQCLALERLKKDFPEFDYNLVAWCEIDKSAIIGHNALFPEWVDRNIGDITKVRPEDMPDCDCVTWTFPCQDISNAGKKAGLSTESETRSSLCWDAIRIIKAKKPKYLLMENVRTILSKRFHQQFQELIEALEEIGYSNFYTILDSADYNVPQSRKRCYMLSVLDSQSDYMFPAKIKLEKCLRDVLDKDVPDKYYLKQKQLDRIIEHCERKVAEGCGFRTNFRHLDGISGTIKTKEGQREYDTYVLLPMSSEPINMSSADETLTFLEEYHPNYYESEEIARIEDLERYISDEYDMTDLSDPANILREEFPDKKDAYAEMQRMKSQEMIRAVENYNSMNRSPDELAVYRDSAGSQFRIRKLTPTEIGRLMDLSEQELDKLKMTGLSDTSLIKIFGNSIVVQVLFLIFRNLFITKESEPRNLFNYE